MEEDWQGQTQIAFGNDKQITNVGQTIELGRRTLYLEEQI
jgi:hypothetical protein